MTECSRMAELYRSIYEGDNGEAWHGPALLPLLKDVSAEQASLTPIPGAHSILQLVLHLAYWEEVVLRRFSGELANAALNDENDWPRNRPVSAEEWRAALLRLDHSHQALQGAIAGCADARLDDKVTGRDYSLYILLHGIIDHCVYHSAQIALLKKASSSS
jgi:uncharacterized damage-inducible protein DinB